MTNTATATWVHEFPEADYDISPIILNAEGIKDLSWHNDVCPSFGTEIRLPDGDSVEFSIWCEVDDLAQREAGEGKYTVTVQPWGDDAATLLHDVHGIPCSPWGENVWSGDDPAEALTVFRRTVATATAALIAAGMVPEQD